MPKQYLPVRQITEINTNIRLYELFFVDVFYNTRGKQIVNRTFGSFASPSLAKEEKTNQQAQTTDHKTMLPARGSIGKDHGMLTRRQRNPPKEIICGVNWRRHAVNSGAPAGIGTVAQD